MSGPLSHIKVLDLSRVLAAPWAAQNLADLGAEVIKVERPLKGDDSRAYAPPYLKDEHGKETRESAYFCAANRGKKSITINISKPEGQQLVRELAHELLAFGFGDIDRDRFLAAIRRAEIRRLTRFLAVLVLEIWRRVGARVVALQRTLDLDDLSAEIGQ